MRLLVALVCVAATLVARRPAAAMDLDELDQSHPWDLGSLRFVGNDAIRRRVLERAIVTHARSLLTPWQARPPFDPIVVRGDLDRLTALYRGRGYYEAQVTANLLPRPDGVTIDLEIVIDEGLVVRVLSVDVTVEGDHVPDEAALRAGLALRPDEPFTAADYDGARTALRSAWRRESYARVTVTKAATVDLDRHEATVRYAVASGPRCTFGSVRVTGTSAVTPAIVLAEVPFRDGDRFAEALLVRTRTNLLALNLFRTVRIEESPGTSPVVDVEIAVTELPPHDVQLGIGYDSEEGPRGIAGWRHYDFLGGARQLGFSARASFITRTIAADFLQPHFPTPQSRLRLLFLEEIEDEEAFDVLRTRGGPRLEWTPVPAVSAYAFYRAEHDHLSNVTQAIERRLPDVAPSSYTLSSAGVGVDLAFADDLIDPRRGILASASVEPVGLGGDLHYVRLLAEGRVYHPLHVWDLLGAARLRVGTAAPYDGTREIPLPERFYAGGTTSVRGYERWHAGPLVDDEPLGGRSLVETSLEIRRSITEELGAAVFVDAGTVGLSSSHLPFDDLHVGAGFGVRYRSPVGPIRVDLGFPVDPPRRDAVWQLHVSVGPGF